VLPSAEPVVESEDAGEAGVEEAGDGLDPVADGVCTRIPAISEAGGGCQDRAGGGGRDRRAASLAVLGDG